MPHQKRATNEAIITAYKQTGSVWKAGKLLGICGQSVHERLRALDIKLPSQQWRNDEVEELNSLAPNCTIGEIARRLGRSYAAVACKVSELQIGVRFGVKASRKVKRGSGLNKASISKLTKELTVWDGSIRQFCIQRGIDLEVFVQAIQIYQPDFWAVYVAEHSSLAVKLCPQCKCEFVPMTSKQRTCSRRCQTRHRVDKQYFGGKRNNAVGIEEGICQLCEKEKPNLSAHHVYGKEHDPENNHMIALCAGCHSLVGRLGVRSDIQDDSFWENLISLAVARKLGHRKPVGFYVCVEIEELTQEDFDEEAEYESTSDTGQAGVIDDDARIVHVEASKVFPGEHELALDVPGVRIEIQRA